MAKLKAPLAAIRTFSVPEELELRLRKHLEAKALNFSALMRKLLAEELDRVENVT